MPGTGERRPLADKDLNTPLNGELFNPGKRKHALVQDDDSPFDALERAKTSQWTSQIALKNNTPMSTLSLSSRHSMSAVSTTNMLQYAGDTPRVSKTVKGLRATNSAVSASKSNSISATMSATGKQAILAAQTETWKKKYRKAFPQFVFYFDHVDANTLHQVAKQAKQLGASVELFFSAKVTHVITTREIPEMVESEERKDVATPASIMNRAMELAGTTLEDLRAAAEGPSNKSSDILTMALQRGMKVWSLNKLVKQVLRRLIDQPKSSSSRPQDLSLLLQDEKVYGTKERDPTARRQDRHYFKAPFLLIEDATKQHRPVMVKEFHHNLSQETPPWPQIYWQNPAGRSLFVYYGPPADEANVEQADLQDAAVAAGAVVEMPSSRMPLGRVDSNASGIVASITSAIASTKSNMSCNNNTPTGVPQHPTFERLGKRELASRREGPTNRKGFAPAGKDQAAVKAAVKKRKSRPLYVRAMEANKPGYCENCRAKYEDFIRHAKSKEHRRFALDNENWRELDELLTGLNRVLLPGYEDVAVETEDESCLDGDGDVTEDELDEEDISQEYVSEAYINSAEPDVTRSEMERAYLELLDYQDYYVSRLREQGDAMALVYDSLIMEKVNDIKGYIMQARPRWFAEDQAALQRGQEEDMDMQQDLSERAKTLPRLEEVFPSALGLMTEAGTEGTLPDPMFLKATSNEESPVKDEVRLVSTSSPRMGIFSASSSGSKDEAENKDKRGPSTVLIADAGVNPFL